jgi:hypothetical protein
MTENAAKLMRRALGIAIETKDETSIEKLKRYLVILEDRELNTITFDWSSEGSSTE